MKAVCKFLHIIEPYLGYLAISNATVTTFLLASVTTLENVL